MTVLESTDRLVSPSVARQRRRKTLVRAIAISSLTLTALFFLYGWIRPSVDRQVLRTAIAELGPVEATIAASGVVLPEHEQVITSPIETRVITILKHAGDRLAKGETIMVLDTSEAHLALERTDDNLTVKENELSQRELQLRMEQSDFAGRKKIKELEAQLSTGKAEQLRQLFAIGGASKGQVTQAELEEKVAAIELEQIDLSSRNNEQVAQSQLANLRAQAALLRRERSEMERLLEMASTRAERDGVVTWVIEQEGIAVRKSDPIARVSDLAAYRVEATVSDVHADQLSAGLPVHVVVNESTLEGTVTSVNPTIQSGVMTLNARLNDPSDARLHSHMRVDVYVVTARKDHTMRIARGQVTESHGTQPIFVVHGDYALRRDVQVGLMGYEYAEITDGLAVGDTVITSNMREYAHLNKLRID